MTTPYVIIVVWWSLALLVGFYFAGIGKLITYGPGMWVYTVVMNSLETWLIFEGGPVDDWKKWTLVGLNVLGVLLATFFCAKREKIKYTGNHAFWALVVFGLQLWLLLT